MRTSRRHLLMSLAAATAGAALAACAGAQPTATPAPAAPAPAKPAAPAPTTAPAAAAKPTAAPAAGAAAKPTTAPAAAAAAKPTAAVPAAKPAANTAGKTVVKFMHFYSNPLMENLNRRLALFDEHPKFAVEGVQTPGGAAYRDKLITMIAGGVAPDAFLISQAPGSGYTFGMLAARGQMIDMNPLVKRDNYDIDDYFKVIVDYDTYQGKLYALPNDINVYAFFYNTDLFKEAGVEPLPADWGNQQWNWQALVDKATKLTKRSGNRVSSYGFVVRNSSIEWLQPWLWNNGASDLNQDWTAAAINSPQAIETLAYLQDLIHKHKVSPTPAEVQEVSEGELFFTGRLAMTYTGAVFVNASRNQIKRFGWDTGANVVGKVDKVTASGGASFGMSPQSKIQDGAWELCKTLSGPKSQAVGAEYGQMPARVSVANSPAYMKSDLPPEHLPIFIEAAKNARPGYLITNWAQIDEAMRKELDYLWLNERKPAEVAANMESVINKLLKESDKF